MQKIAESRHRKVEDNQGAKKRGYGERKPCDVWTVLLVCECGYKFNRKAWHRSVKGIQYGYQCYSSIRTGTVTTRQNRGLSTEGICTVPMIAGWKLQMMAKHIFREYLKDTAQVLALAESILIKHIDDEEQEEDNTKIIKQRQDEREKLNKRLHNLIEMRADGEITRDVFKIKQEEIEKRLAEIDAELDKLNPEIQDKVEEATHEEKIKILRYYLEQSVNPSDTDDVPEDVIRAFVIKIVAHEDGFDWYLRFSPDKDPTKLSIEGKRKDTAKVSSLGCLQHRLQSRANSIRFSAHQFGGFRSQEWKPPFPCIRKCPERIRCAVFRAFLYNSGINPV